MLTRVQFPNGNRTGALSDALGWGPDQGRTGRIAGIKGRIPHLSAGVCSGRKALSYIGLAQGSTPPSPCRSSNRYAPPETLTSPNGPNGPNGPMLGR